MRSMRSQVGVGEIEDREFLSALFGRIRLFWRARGGTEGMLPVRLACILLQSENRQNYKSAGPRDYEIYIFPKFFKLFSKLCLAVAGEGDERWTKNANKFSLDARNCGRSATTTQTTRKK